MGRKKRKVAVEEEDAGAAVVKEEESNESIVSQSETTAPSNKEPDEKEAKSSKYAISSHSGEIVREDIYVSDGSEDEEEDVEVVLAGSRSGIMRRGLTAPATMIQPNRQWVRPGDEAKTGAGAGGDEDAVKPEDLEKLDPVQRAARLQAEKQRLELQEKEEERLKESQENAGRDPTLFSKRTAFDIRFDQMEDKPWERASDIADFFNYGLDEEGWLEYAQQQLTIRQELTDAARAKRQPDPIVVPVAPRAPTLQAPRVAVVGNSSNMKKNSSSSGSRAQTSDGSGNEGDDNDDGGDNMVLEEDDEPEDMLAPLGPLFPTEDSAMHQDDDGGGAIGSIGGSTGPAAMVSSAGDVPTESEKFNMGAGGAWGAGALPGSLLAKLIEEQEQREAELNVNDSADGISESGNYQYDGEEQQDTTSITGGGFSEGGGSGHYNHYGGGGKEPDESGTHTYNNSGGGGGGAGGGYGPPHASSYGAGGGAAGAETEDHYYGAAGVSDHVVGTAGAAYGGHTPPESIMTHGAPPYEIGGGDAMGYSNYGSSGAGSDFRRGGGAGGGGRGYWVGSRGGRGGRGGRSDYGTSSSRPDDYYASRKRTRGEWRR